MSCAAALPGSARHIDAQTFATITPNKLDLLAITMNSVWACLLYAAKVAIPHQPRAHFPVGYFALADDQ